MGCLLTQAAEMRLEKEEPGDARGSRRGQRLKGWILPAPTTLSDGNAAPNGPIVAPRQGQARHSGDRVTLIDTCHLMGTLMRPPAPAGHGRTTGLSPRGGGTHVAGARPGFYKQL